jgi:hypothetical protein
VASGRCPSAKPHSRQLAPTPFHGWPERSQLPLYLTWHPGWRLAEHVGATAPNELRGAMNRWSFKTFHWSPTGLKVEA